jgi:nitroreductase
VTDIFTVVRGQRACRDFSDAPVDDDVLAQILEAATYAPSAENRQPWEFVVVRDARTRDQIHDLTEAAWRDGGRAFSEQRVDARLLAEVDHAIAGGGYRSAPVLVVVAADTERGLVQTVPSSIFPAIQNLLLAANALGLGSALTTLTTVHAGKLQRLLALPEHVVPQAVVPLGRPARPLGPPRREPFSAHTHRDQYGTPW